MCPRNHRLETHEVPQTHRRSGRPQSRRHGVWRRVALEFEHNIDRELQQRDHGRIFYTSTTSGRSAVTAGPLHAVLHGANHAPKLGRPWSYSMTVTDAVGHPLSGTVDIVFTFGGQVVGHDTPPTHPVRNGTWHDTLTFPAAAVGQQLMFRAVVHASLGSVTLDWPIVVQR